MTILHHYPLSAGSRYVRLLMAEFGENPTLTEEQPWERSETLLKLNPAGTVPVLIDDDETVVSGASVIGEYLNEPAGRGWARSRR